MNPQPQHQLVAQLGSTSNINGNIGSSSQHMNPSISSKKENNFQKLNKQSTMLYLHHHPQG
jgi:hypothetical protein